MRRQHNLDEKAILDQLEELAQTLGIQVRYEPIEIEGSFYAGDLCRLKGENILIINPEATIKDKIQIFARAVKRFDLNQVYIRPALREFLSKKGQEEKER